MAAGRFHGLDFSALNIPFVWGNRASIYALDAPIWEKFFVDLPESIADADWKALTSLIQPEFGQDEVPPVDGLRRLRSEEAWSPVGQYIANLAVACCGQAAWKAGESLGDIITMSSDYFGEIDRTPWSGLYETLGGWSVVGGRKTAMPWWLQQGFNGHWAGLTSPGRLREIVSVITAEGAMSEGLARYQEAEGVDLTDVIVPWIEFLRKSAQRGHWTLGIEGA